MSEKARQAVWEQIKASELIGSDVVPLPIETVKLLLECARIINEAGASKTWATSKNRHAFSVPVTEYISDEELRTKCIELSQRL